MLLVIVFFFRQHLLKSDILFMKVIERVLIAAVILFVILEQNYAT